MNDGRWWWLAVLLAGCGMAPPAPEPTKVARLELSCARHSVAAYDFTRSLLADRSLACVARVGDLQNAALPGRQVNFLAEAGRLRGGTSNSEGEIDVVHEVSLPTPLDVPPVNSMTAVLNDATHTGQPIAPEWMRSAEWGTQATLRYSTQLRGEEPNRPDPIRRTESGRPINNPRDNLVTLVAWVDGSEPLDDTNGNGQADPGESFVDLTEPFVDANDDGTWNQGEAFIDSNGNRQWDGKNLTWDQQTKLWVQERVVWTGLPAAEDVSFAVPGVVGHRSTIMSPRQLVLTCPVGTSSCASAVDLNNPSAPGAVRFYMADPWFNTMARPHTGNGCVVVPDVGATLVTYGRVSANVDGTNDVPDGLSGTVTVSDVRDPNSPQTNRPRTAPMLRFTALIRCQVSDGTPTGQLTVAAGLVEGSIE